MATTTTQSDLLTWLAAQTWSNFAQSLARSGARRPLTPAQRAAAESMRAKCVARRPVAAVAAVDTDPGNLAEAAMVAAEIAADAPARATDPGIYFGADGGVYKVKMGRNGRPYAMRLTGGSFRYASGAIFALTADMRATPELAAAYGRRTGTCCCCGAHLEDRDELGARVGVGPVCAPKYFGLTQRQMAARLGV